MVSFFICILILLFLCLLIWPTVVKRYVSWRWDKSLRLKQHSAVFQKIYRTIDGFALSKQARRHHDAPEYTYGEIEFTSFIALISLTRPTSNTQFYDLGSGTGKAVLACAMVFDMKLYCGIELFKELHQAALLQQQALQQTPGYSSKSASITFIQDNFLNINLSHASLIFINASALFGETWGKLNEQLTHDTVTGTIIITTSKPLISSPKFIVIQTTRTMMSWGIVMAYIHSVV